MSPIISSDAHLHGITIRQRAILKLQYGWLPLTAAEMEWVLPEMWKHANEIKRRSLTEVAGLTLQRSGDISTETVSSLRPDRMTGV